MRLLDWRQRGMQKRSARRLAPELACLEGRALMSTLPTTTSTVPTTTADVMGHRGANGYYTSPVTVNLSANEANVPSSSLSTEYSINNGPPTAGNHIFLSQNGVDRITFVSTDQSGNVGPAGSLTIRIDRTPPVLTVSANPTTLWPPNHKFDTVHVSGMAFDRNSGIAGSEVCYFVRDEYGQVQPSGVARVDENGMYSFNVNLQASRTGQDHDGRQYTIIVVAHNGAGEVSWRTATVTVPHDQGHQVGYTGYPSNGYGWGGMVGGPVDDGGGQGNHGHGNGHQNGHGNGNGHGHGHGHG